MIDGPVEESPVSGSEPVDEPIIDEPVMQEPVDEPIPEAVEEGSPVSEPVIEQSEAESAPEEPVIEDMVEELIQQDTSVESASPVSEPVIEGGSDLDVPAEVEEELGEDMFTDYSPEAVVRRAAWNKGLRCRRGYGEHNIPVAFVKGKVAVYVEGADADTSIDDILREEGWTVLRYDASTITDGKAQGEEINQAVKANNRAAKAASKKKKKPAAKK